MLTRLHERTHRLLVFDRRRERLIAALSAMVPAESSVIDVGCGNGEVGAGLVAAGHTVEGVETLERESCEIPFQIYDGANLPFDDDSFDWATIVDVLHHCADPSQVVAEALRVSRRGVIIKDHYSESARQDFTLGVMDWVGNRQFGVGREGAYLSRDEWSTLWGDLGLAPRSTNEDIGLYPAPLSWVFEKGLHFVVRLEPVG